MTDLPIVDAHQHFWDLERNYLPWLCDEEAIPFRYGDYSALRRNYLPPDYRRDAAGHNVVRTVYVETEWDPRDFVGETRWLQEIIAATGFPHAHRRRRAPRRPRGGSGAGRPHRLPAGARHPPQAAGGAGAGRGADRRAPGSMGDPAWRRGYALLEQYALSFDLQTPWWHLAEAAALARDFPNTQIILNHTGLPADRSPEGLAGWRRAMQTLAAEPNVALKISGLGQPGQPWTIAANGPIVRDAIAIFGVDRCMFASNFPVDGLCADFDTIFRGFKTIVADLSQAEQSNLFCANALRFYRLDPLP